MAGRTGQDVRISAGAVTLVMKPRRPEGGSLVPIRLGHPCVDLDLAPPPCRGGHNHAANAASVAVRQCRNGRARNVHLIYEKTENLGLVINTG